MRLRTLLRCYAAIVTLVGLTTAHRQPPTVPDDADWQTRHMAEEHHIENFDAGSFFQLHDFDGNGQWDGEEIQRFYGLNDPSNKDIPETKRLEIRDGVLNLIDYDKDGRISKTEWLGFAIGGGTLPDYGTKGHHADAETEYELHHWEQYHDENTTEEDLIHPEDIEHFKQHDEMEAEAERVAEMDRLSIVEKNIPQKFLNLGVNL